MGCPVAIFQIVNLPLRLDVASLCQSMNSAQRTSRPKLPAYS